MSVASMSATRGRPSEASGRGIWFDHAAAEPRACRLVSTTPRRSRGRAVWFRPRRGGAAGVPSPRPMPQAFARRRARERPLEAIAGSWFDPAIMAAIDGRRSLLRGSISGVAAALLAAGGLASGCTSDEEVTPPPGLDASIPDMGADAYHVPDVGTADGDRDAPADTTPPPD